MAGRKRIYYPSGAIQKGLYTSGQELMSEDGLEYFGQYHIYTNTNEIFSESEYVKGKSVKLIRYSDLREQNIKKNFDYNRIKEIEDYEFDVIVPDPIQITPTDEDYKVGYITRYLLKKKGNPFIWDVDEDGFSFESPNYQKLEIKWKISGPLNDVGLDSGIIDTNRRTINIYKNDFEGLEFYLNNLTQFAKV